MATHSCTVNRTVLKLRMTVKFNLFWPGECPGHELSERGQSGSFRVQAFFFYLKLPGPSVSVLKTVGPAVSVLTTFGPAVSLRKTFGPAVSLRKTFGPAVFVLKTFCPAISLRKTFGSGRCLLNFWLQPFYFT